MNDPDAAACARAERAFVRRLDGGCSSPVAAFAAVAGETITVEGLYVDEQGRARRAARSGPRDRGEILAEELADWLKEGRI